MGDLFEVRSILAFMAVGGFIVIAVRAMDRLVDPPASELFAILNLMLALPLGASAYYFGVQAGKKMANGNPPKDPPGA